MQIAFFGTSLTAVNDWQTNSFVQNIQNKYNDYKVDNFGVGGANSFKILQKIQKIFDNNINAQYDLVFIEMGTNDILRKHQGRFDKAIDIKLFEENYKKSLDILKQKSKKVICISSPPVSNSFEYDINDDIKKYNFQLKKICNEKKCVFVNVFDEFDIHGELWSDGLHLNKDGDSIIAELIEKYL